MCLSENILQRDVVIATRQDWVYDQVIIDVSPAIVKVITDDSVTIKGSWVLESVSALSDEGIIQLIGNLRRKLVQIWLWLVLHIGVVTIWYPDIGLDLGRRAHLRTDTLLVNVMA